ncbi:hypothetical protein F8M41_009091 [Gigaspora margarita]|uniref:Uncharacterized protein n=1 Tax=Gigaspora margarita TaxID=4874 RepID=A0A8H4A256_GIGMA|nr:hypothetical protein F8M41_009091 [Gigaspora margarita]
MLACPDPTPLEFFQFIFPSHRIKASEKYKKAFDLAFKKTILVRRGVHKTNPNLHEEINTLSLSKDAKNMKSNPVPATSEEDQEEEKSADNVVTSNNNSNHFLGIWDLG